MKQLTLMIKAPDGTRADIALSSERVYFRLATDDNVEENTLDGLEERFELVAFRILDGMKPQAGEDSIDAAELKVTAFIDNLIHPTRDLSKQSLQRAITTLETISPSFSTLHPLLP